MVSAALLDNRCRPVTMPPMELKHLLAAKVLPPIEERRLLRTDLELTLGDLARVLGVTRSAVSRWERGIRTPRNHNKTRYAALLRQLASIPPSGRGVG